MLIGTACVLLGGFCSVVSAAPAPSFQDLGASNAAPVVVSDDFEDGNWMANPAWSHANPGHGLDGGVVADPVRSNNLVWMAQGIGGAPYTIATTDFAPISWNGFHASVEILGFSGHIGVMNAIEWNEGFSVTINRDSFSMGEYNAEPPTVVPHGWSWDGSAIPANEWLQMNLWHDPEASLIKADLRRVSDGHVYVEHSFAPMSFGTLPLSWFFIGPQTLPGWQYMDNATLTSCCNTDTDSDGICDDADNCPTVVNPTQVDTDHDGVGDACDNCPFVANADQSDGDHDGVGNVCDNCPEIANPDQADFDGGGAGDLCDDDIDNDGVPNDLDACSYTPLGAKVNESGTLAGDLDGDCDVDLEDYRILSNDFTGPNP